MELTLIRQDKTDKSTIGGLSVNTVRICYILEDVVRAEGVKVQNDTAIPEGRYEVVINYSPRFKRQMPLLLDVPNFSGIRIHTGNTSKDTEGCLITGTTKSKDRVAGSRVAYAKLLALLSKAYAVKERVFITIRSV